MIRKLILHIGPSKTGTSAIQSFFRDNKPDGILYPETGRWPDGSHHKLVFAYQGKQKYGLIHIPLWKQLLCSLEEEIDASSEDILISSEMSSVEFVEGLQPLVRKFNLNLHLILVARNPVERAASAFNQGVKDAVVGMSQDPKSYLIARTNEFRFRPLFEKWATLGCPIVVLPYKDTLPLIQRFCDVLDISIKSDVIEKFPNKSMGGTALIAILIANKLLSDEAQRREFFTQLQTNPSFKIWRGNSFPFDKEACEVFFNAIKEDIDWMIAQFNFSKAIYYKASKESFLLSDNDVQDIYAQLEKFDLVDGNAELIDNTLSPYINNSV